MAPFSQLADCLGASALHSVLLESETASAVTPAGGTGVCWGLILTLWDAL